MSQAAPPRLVVRTSIAILATVAVLLSGLFVALILDVRDRVRAEVLAKLEAGHRMLSALEDKRGDDLTTQVALLAENSTLKAALDIYQSESAMAKPASSREMVATVARELDKIAARIKPDVLALTDASGRTVAVSGRLAAGWPATLPGADGDATAPRLLLLPAGGFRLAGADVVLQEDVLGRLQLATALDGQYARELSTLSGAATLIATSSQVLTTTLPDSVAAKLDAATLRSLPLARVARIGGTQYAIRELLREADAGVYVLDSIDEAAAPALRQAGRTILLIALATFALAGFASVWLARTLARPINTLARSLADMSQVRAFDPPLAKCGSSREIDSLTGAFNDMMAALRAAEEETQSAYVGTIRALAMTLDARDRYTAGHSERVSALSVAVGQHMALEEDQIEVLRLGALLHDIGKVGVPDDVLRKPNGLTAEEFEAIKLHPGLGARILRTVPFLAPHIPIVELHHERPDGSGYPHRLRGDEIPLLARIVHVTDAFDAMTSARAYRPARSSAEALRELWRCAGAEFDAEVVHALASALPSIDLAPTQSTTPVLRLASSYATGSCP